MCEEGVPDPTATSVARILRAQKYLFFAGLYSPCDVFIARR